MESKLDFEIYVDERLAMPVIKDGITQIKLGELDNEKTKDFIRSICILAFISRKFGPRRLVRDSDLES